MASSLKKYRKSQLIELIQDYEQDIINLQEELELNIKGNTIVEKEYIIVDETNDKTIIYIQKRIKTVHDKIKKDIYVNELNRLLPNKSN